MTVSKDEYILKTFSKIQHKQWELYIITRMIHLLDDPELEFVCQQLIKTSDHKRYLADLCFPEIELYFDAIVSDGFGNALSVDTEGGSISVSILGDISSDSEVDVIDVVNMISYILFTAEPTDYQFWAADINNDSVLNILDVVMLVDLILGNQP